MKKIFKRCLALILILSLFLTTSISAVSVEQLNTDLRNKYMILVNRNHKLSSDYVPTDLVYYKNSDYKLEKTCAAALSEMIDDCPGETLVLYSGYRSYKRQYDKYYGKINQYISQGYTREKAIQLTDQYYAPPGGSEHHTGLAADICLPSIVNKYGQLHESFAGTTQGKWLKSNAHKYGFILRYDKGKEKITGYNYEPWHFRYVGKDHAKKIYESGLTFEEYIQSLKNIQTKLSSAPKVIINGNSITFTAPCGTQIRYTSDNRTPTLESSKLSSSLSGRNVTYKAIACYQGYTSAVSMVTITKYGDIFKDITVKDWYYTTVSDAVHRNIFSGMGDYTFAPQSTMTRAMLVQVLANMSGVNLKQYNKSSYSDVNTKSWYAPAVQWATENNIVQGMGDGKFAPVTPVTREQVCVIFYNYSKSKAPNKLPSFSDKATISSWAKNSVAFCATNGIVNGYPDNTFRPRNSATRAEVAKISLKYLEI